MANRLLIQLALPAVFALSPLVPQGAGASTSSDSGEWFAITLANKQIAAYCLDNTPKDGTNCGHGAWSRFNVEVLGYRPNH